jgi:CRISPR-associated protein Csm3
MQFQANIIIRGLIHCETGLHIGGSKDKMEIGGVDSPVIRDPYSKYPFIPGSSLKGKMRTMLEYSLGKVGPNGDPSEEEEIIRIFGTSADKDRKEPLGPTRLIVRDCRPTPKTVRMWEELDSELLYTEYKGENGINRLTSMANPRFVERVVAGSEFAFEMVYSVFDGKQAHTTEKVKEDLDRILLALRLLEHSAIGKSGSRGYGKISFKLDHPRTVFASDYEENSETYKASVAPLSESLLSLADYSLTYDHA